MAKTLSKEEVAELPIDERLRLIGRLWDSIAAEDLPLSASDARLIDDRLTEHREDPQEGISIDESRAALRQQR